MKTFYFDFDQSALRPEATAAPRRRHREAAGESRTQYVIEGHTCNIGTAEYNLALGDRRASSVRDYLVSRGIAANRLETRQLR